ncbi:predicted protein [Arabidopsis lyrata subsp. lyrata]|uniref:Predicted protein n=1 Tax=Arabidopsis lyrata subsp. lyrata TaxID=81972 RepID=D7MHG2_ARALL|nr:predicted protein [Arabidopsis lyrata subsp. lyrata]
MSAAVVAEDEAGVMTVCVTLFPRFVEDEEAKPGDASLKMGVTTGGSGVTGGELSGTEIGTGEDRVAENSSYLYKQEFLRLWNL